METDFIDELTPEKKEGIEKAIWIDKNSIGTFKNEIYQNINLVITNYLDSNK